MEQMLRQEQQQQPQQQQQQQQLQHHQLHQHHQQQLQQQQPQPPSTPPPAVFAMAPPAPVAVVNAATAPAVASVVDHQQHQQQMTQESNTSNVTNSTNANDDTYGDVIDRMVTRVSMLENSPIRPPGTAESDGHHHHHHHQVGPLTSHELAELSLLCTRQEADMATTTNDTTTNNNNAATTRIGFNTVEGEQLESLVELLDKHMNLATGIHHLQNAVNVIKSDESPTRAAAALKHVRCFFAFFVFVCLYIFISIHFLILFTVFKSHFLLLLLVTLLFTTHSGSSMKPNMK